MKKKRGKVEKRYMGKEDVKALTATLAPPSPHVALPSAPSPSERLCSTIENASALIIELQLIAINCQLIAIIIAINYIAIKLKLRL